MPRLFSHLMLSSLLLALLFTAVAWAQEDSTGAGPQPSCLMPELRKELGEIFEQDKYTHDFIVKNVGEADLEIVSVRPG
jgi:hypothetical protein